MSEFTVSAGTPHVVKSCHPFLSAMRDITQPFPSAAGLIVISAFFARLFSYLFFQLITASCSLASRARGFLSVIFPPPGNYVGAADQTREEADAALKKSRFAYLNPVRRINGERRRTKRKERARREDRAKKGCVLSYPCEDGTRQRTARARAPRQWAVFAHPKIGRRRKNAATIAAWDKNYLGREKKQSKGKRLIGGHMLTTLNLVTLALTWKDSLLSNAVTKCSYVTEILRILW